MYAKSKIAYANKKHKNIDAKIGFNPCFAWRSLWNSRQILLSGCRWSIGTGTRICVIHAPWLQDNHCAWVPSPQHTNVYSLFVCDLMSRDEHIWDFTEIEDFFSAGVSRVIDDTPLFQSISEDQSRGQMRKMDCIRLSQIPVCYHKKFAQPEIFSLTQPHLPLSSISIYLGKSVHQFHEIIR